MLNKTVAPLLPATWKLKQIKDICDVVRGSSPRPAGSPLYFDGDHLPWATVADLTKDEDMHLNTTKSMLTAEGAKLTRIVNPGTLLLTNSGATLGVPKISRIKCGANDGIAMLLNLKNINTEFAYYFLSSKTQFLREVIAPGVGQPNLNTELIGSLPLPVPPMVEQIRIAEILSTWDQAISAAKQLLDNSQQQKKILSRQLINGNKHFSIFEKNRKTVAITDCLQESILRNHSLELNIKDVKSVNKSEGMIPMREETIGKSIERYKIVRRGWFAYNPMRINVGSICRWEEDTDCLVSPDYVVFSCNESMLLGSYFDQYRKSDAWAVYMENAGRGSVRVRIYLKDLSNLKISLPKINEQKKLTKILLTADREIEALKKKVSLLKEEKKALMQQLLTGKIRVKVETA